MPKQSERQQTIQELEQVLVLQELIDFSSDGEDYENSINSDNNNDNDNNNDIIWAAYIEVQCQCYLEPRSCIARSPDRLNWLLYELDDKRFKQEARMSRQYFQDLLIHIEGHSIFQNKSNNPQRPIHHQLLVTLKRFGCFGNGASVGVIARFFGLSGKFLYYLIYLV
jgi:hypothetical protein